MDTTEILEVLAIAIALSLDAFAVSLAASSTGRVSGRRATFRLSFHFGFFQFFMPVLGWLLGRSIEPTMAAFDHWIAFLLLTFVGARMIRAGGHTDSDRQPHDPSRGITLVLLSLATSIDALAVGLSLAMLRLTVWFPCLAIGVVTAGMSTLGCAGGSRLSRRFGERTQVGGGLILFPIGLRILVSHLTAR